MIPGLYPTLSKIGFFELTYTVKGLREELNDLKEKKSLTLNKKETFYVIAEQTSPSIYFYLRL